MPPGLNVSSWAARQIRCSRRHSDHLQSDAIEFYYTIARLGPGPLGKEFCSPLNNVGSFMSVIILAVVVECRSWLPERARSPPGSVELSVSGVGVYALGRRDGQ